MPVDYDTIIPHLAKMSSVFFIKKLLILEPWIKVTNQGTLEGALLLSVMILYRNWLVQGTIPDNKRA